MKEFITKYASTIALLVLFIVVVNTEKSKTVRVLWTGGLEAENKAPFVCINCNSTHAENGVTTIPQFAQAIDDDDDSVIHDFACGSRDASFPDLQSIGTWNDGWASFEDPLPSNTHITDVKVILHGRFDCTDTSKMFGVLVGPEEEFTKDTLLATFNTTAIPSKGSSPSCCATCPRNIELNHTNLISPHKYRFQGKNYVGIQHDIIDDDDLWTICLSSVEIVLFYDTNDSIIYTWITLLFVLCIICLVAAIMAAYFFARSKARKDFESFSNSNTNSAFAGNIQQESSPLLSDSPSWELSLDKNDLALGKKIGRGSFGEVYVAESKSLGKVAIKMIPLDIQTKNMLDSFLKEIMIMKKLRHPNVLLFLGTTELQDKLCIIMEYMPRGSLNDLLQDDKVEMSFERKKALLIDAAKGMNYLHCSDPPIIHRDLKSHNLLVDEYWRCKVADFGLSRSLDPQNESLTMVGTPCWTAPEILRHENYTVKADVFSFGVVMWETITRQKPFKNKTAYQVILDVVNNGARPPIPSNLSHELASLITDCWQEEAMQRPSFHEILKRLKNISQ